ncbi:hypothetical protein J4217_03475 [Candidatus Pacearchaeota archaeon]|nr:hypothetical protein [Candidatus Pacearchaeota archaeon]
MQIVGFNLTKILAERKLDLSENKSINTNIEFPKIEKEKIELLKDAEAYRIDFKFTVSYSKNQNQEKEKEKDKEKDKAGEIAFQGNIILSIGKDEPKEIIKSLKKEELPLQMKEAFLNLLLKKCTAKALDLEDQLGLPFHVPFPRVKLQAEEKK